MAQPQHIVIATGNPHKVREFQEILDPFGIGLLTPREVGGLPEVDETGDTFAANAILKAESACAHTGQWALADDSGIAARALGGAPGVRSARYAGEPCDDAANNRKLVEALRPHSDRHVAYVCVIALARPGCAPLTWEGTFAGRLVDQAQGEGGFGYDPHVWIDDCACTVAQMPAAEKHRRSHRGQALRGFVAWLAQQGG
ncbi:MAG: RdgB/HAM1 family non-canonical purine NTP pyrophosphatase [Planctomycetota bacterium]|nr:MAG: RdgB/HAM1 family non-canonical purine NTP pyrophosphatase [Planctomycetota bacterium]